MVALNRASLRLKAEAIRCYAGRLVELHPAAGDVDVESVLNAAEVYARQVGLETGGTHAERLWRLRS